MSSENDLDISRLYGELRAALLSRHFALGKYFRANLFSLGNNLSYPYPHYDELRLLPEPGQTIERWHIDFHSRENALADTGRVLSFLAIEHLLGRADSKVIIQETLITLASLYKFSGNHFDGYIIRWDPATSDNWDSDPCGRLQPCNEFLIGSNGDYLYSTPLDDPRYTPMLGVQSSPGQPDDPGDLRWRSLDWHRRWEPSMDEIVGLVSGYFMVYQLVDDQSIRSEVRRQLQNLGDYLAEYGYIMVKPGGGFAARPSGHLPVVEYPFGRVFARIVGNAFPSRASFEDALVAAGVWPCIKAQYDRWSTIGTPAAIAFYTDTIVPLLSTIGVPLSFISLLEGHGIDFGVIAGRAAAISCSLDCFDVWDANHSEAGKQSFIAAYLLKQLTPLTRFTAYLPFAGAGSLMPRVCLTSLDDQDDQTVRTSYLNWFHTGFPSNATAIAALLGAGEEVERSLANHIAGIYNLNKDYRLRNLELVPEPDDKHPGEGTIVENDGDALEYLETLALTWLHVWRRARAGIPVNPGIGLPDLPEPSLWPPVAVPKAVYDSSQVVLPRDAIQNQMPPSEDSTYGYDLYSNPPPKPVLPPPVPRYTNYELAVDREIVVRESDRDLDTGLDINSGDRVVFDAQGEIWAGVLGIPNNGPEGWWNTDTDRKFPLPGWHPYGLLGKLGVRYFPIGRHYEYPYHTPTYDGEIPRLYLRINDDRPGNGSGEFTCHMRVWREKPIPHLRADHRKLISLETLPGIQTFEVAVRNDAAQPLTITDCRISPSNMQSIFTIDMPSGGITIEGCNRVSVSLRGTFRPTAPGAYSANFEIISNDPSGAFPNVALFGFAGPPQALIQVQPTRLDLRPGLIGEVTIENRGNRLLSITAITIRENPSNTTANAFSTEAATPRVLNFLESFQFSVSFDPTPADDASQRWQYGGQVLIDSTADNGDHPFPVKLQGLPDCETLASELRTLQEELRTARGAAERAAIMQQINDVMTQMRQLGCG